MARDYFTAEGYGLLPREKTNYQKFWMIYVEGTNGGQHFKQYDYSVARTEAERLAKLNVGKKVYLLECKELCFIEMPSPTWRFLHRA